MRKGNMTILASILAIVLVALGVGAGSMAYFSDKETSTGNTFTAGTLELSPVGAFPGITEVDFALTKMVPGSSFLGTITVKNTGNIPGYLYGRSWYTFTDNDLGDVLMVAYWLDDDSAYAPNILLKNFAVDGPYTGGLHEYGYLNPSQELTFNVEVEWPTTYTDEFDNLYQGASITMFFELSLNQNQLGP